MENRYFLDLDDNFTWLIKDTNGNRYTAGDKKERVIELIHRLNEAHRPNIEQRGASIIAICWNNHEKQEPCEWDIYTFND